MPEDTKRSQQTGRQRLKETWPEGILAKKSGEGRIQDSERMLQGTLYKSNKKQADIRNYYEVINV